MQRLRQTTRTLLAATAAGALALAAPSCTHEYRAYHSTETGRAWEMGGAKVNLEIAKDQNSRQLGLMYREWMPEDHGMLFVYPAPRVLRFWMKNCPLPLSIAFFEELDGGKLKVVNVEEMKPFDESGTVALGAVRIALEMNQGWFTRHGVKAGDVFAAPAWMHEIVPSEDQ